ncbi:MAG: hypothetical protein JWM80_4012, partial [Cyanobacteria bacterium RYN_339]|nr:hypothetical protein [Cyanobacteria bacterium RYN_339]
RATGQLSPLAAAKAAGPSPYLQGSWEYKVVDGKTGYPVAAVIDLVYLEARLVPVRKQLRTDREGFARGQGLPPGRYQLTLQAQGYHLVTEVRFLRPEAPDRATYRIQPT